MSGSCCVGGGAGGGSEQCRLATMTSGLARAADPLGQQRMAWHLTPRPAAPTLGQPLHAATRSSTKRSAGAAPSSRPTHVGARRDSRAPHGWAPLWCRASDATPAVLRKSPCAPCVPQLQANSSQQQQQQQQQQPPPPPRVSGLLPTSWLSRRTHKPGHAGADLQQQDHPHHHHLSSPCAAPAQAALQQHPLRQVSSNRTGRRRCRTIASVGACLLSAVWAALGLPYNPCATTTTCAPCCAFVVGRSSACLQGPDLGCLTSLYPF